MVCMETLRACIIMSTGAHGFYEKSLCRLKPVYIRIERVAVFVLLLDRFELNSPVTTVTVVFYT